MSAAAKSAVNVNAVWTYIQAVDGLIKEHRRMFIIFHHIL
ncbi:hypothetical protein BN133_679 [Cronobacter dublinensis 582]|nr:hypothetical protein BN133_679 [Cronobacter dublinensis 582]